MADEPLELAAATSTAELVDAYIARRRAEGTFDHIDAYLVTMIRLLGRDTAARYFGIRQSR